MRARHDVRPILGTSHDLQNGSGRRPSAPPTRPDRQPHQNSRQDERDAGPAQTCHEANSDHRPWEHPEGDRATFPAPRFPALRYSTTRPDGRNLYRERLQTWAGAHKKRATYARTLGDGPTGRQLNLSQEADRFRPQPIIRTDFATSVGPTARLATEELRQQREQPPKPKTEIAPPRVSTRVSDGRRGNRLKGRIPMDSV